MSSNVKDVGTSTLNQNLNVITSSLSSKEDLTMR